MEYKAMGSENSERSDATVSHRAPTATIRLNGHVSPLPGDPLVLPPGVSSKKFKEFVTRVSDIVGHGIISSVAGAIGRPKIAAYSASKHGIIGLTRTAAREVGERGIK